ncbi:MAG: AAA family ATPase [Bdellovibrionales bacterium]
MNDDFEFRITEAKREAVPPLISLWSKSGGGKTYSALLLARGIVGPTGKIAVIDTENGRAKFYANVSAPWFHLDLQPPFTAEKYSAAFKYCEDWGADIIVVDSGSHVWEGEGGVVDQAESARSRRGEPLDGLAKWNKPKMAHKRMMNKLTRSPIPVIFCLRAKDASKQVGKGKEAEIISIGWQPIAEKNFIYEMTVDLHMTKDGYYDLATSKTIPEGLREIIRPDGRVTVEMGRQIAEWLGSGAAVDPEYLRLKRDGQDAAMQGVTAYTNWIASLSAAEKDLVRHHHKEWQKVARDAEEEDEKVRTSPLEDGFTPKSRGCEKCNGKGFVPWKDETGEGTEPCGCQKAGDR